MHEMGIAMEVMRIAREEAQARGARQVTALTLRIGRWSGVEPESLRFSLEVLAEGSLLQGLRVNIESVEPEFACKACGRKYRADGYFEPCPDCESQGAELVAGTEMTLAQLELEEA